MKTLIGMLSAGALAALMGWATPAAAYSGYWTDVTKGVSGMSCADCHGTTSSCNGCHGHGAYGSSAKTVINIAGTTDKATYAPGETISVTITGGYRNGSFRAAVMDQGGAVLAQASNASYPVTLTVAAPASAGKYGWNVAWYGNDYNPANVFGPGWRPDANNAGHGWEVVALAPFEVVAPAPVTAPKMSVSPTALSFGTILLGGSAQQTTVVSNSGDADLVVGSIGLCAGTSAEFSASPAAPLTVAPGGTSTITVTYAPLDATADQGCIAIAGNDTTNPSANVAVSGAATNPPAPGVLDLDVTKFSVARRWDLSRNVNNAGFAPSVTVVNASTVTAEADAVLVGVLNGAQVYSQTVKVSAAPGTTAKAAFPVFKPDVVGSITWTLTVNDGDPDADVLTATTKVIP